MDEVLYIIGQGLGVVAIVLGFINYQVKTRAQLLYVHMATTVCFAFHYMLIGAWAGMAMNFVGFVRNVVFYFVEKKGKVPKTLAVFFAIVMGCIGVFAWEAWYSVLCVAGLVINSYAMSFSNPNNTRKSILVTSPMVLVYDGFAGSYGGMVYESVAIVSAVVGIIRKRREEAKS